jgi:predicted permease
VIATVALSMTLAATAFAVVDGVLFKPLPYPLAGELYALSGAFDDEPGPGERGVRLMSPLEVATWNEAVPDLAATSLVYSSVRLPDASFAKVVGVDRHFFDVFGSRLLIGGFQPEHFVPGRPLTAMVISERLWREQFDSDSAILGRTFTAFRGRERLEIVGVLTGDGFVPPLPADDSIATRVTNRIDALVARPIQAASERSLIAFARIPPARLAQTRQALSAAVHEFRTSAPTANTSLSEPIRRLHASYDEVDLLPLEPFLTKRERPVLTLAFATAIGLVMLVLLNCGALTAARVQQRIDDFALRRALGARVGDLLRHAMAEQGLLVTAGVFTGVIAAPLLLAAIVARLPPGLTLIKDPRIDWRVTVFAGLMAAVATMLIALLGVRVAVRHAHVAPAALDARGRTPNRMLLGRVLVAGQVALSFSLILGGAFYMASVAMIWREDPGMRQSHGALLTLIPETQTPRSHVADILTDIRRASGVTAAGAYSGSILNNYNSPSNFRPPAGGQSPQAPADALLVSSGFFEAAGIRLRSGRLPSDAELDAGAAIIAVSTRAAREYWPDGTAIGRVLRWGRTDCVVVGVVEDARLRALDFEPAGMIYGSYMLDRYDPFGVQLLIGLGDQPRQALATLVNQIRRFDPPIRVTDVMTIEDALAESIRPRRLSAFIASTFALCALVFVGVGLLGVVAMTSSRRTREVGIRLALGATREGVVRLLIIEELRTVAAGLLAGAMLSAWAVRSIEAHLYKVTTSDAGVWSAAGGLIIMTAALGALAPALRASRTDPMRAIARDG